MPFIVAPETVRCIASPRVLPGLDLLRLFAALHIVSGHLLEPYMLSQNWPSWLIILTCSSASISTSMFFILSGFVLGYSRAVRKQRHVPDGRPRRRFVMRCLRGIPLMITAMLLSTALASMRILPMPVLDWPGEIWAEIKELIISISLISPYYGVWPPSNAPAWAMSVFIIGYAIDSWSGNWLAKQRAGKLVLWISMPLLLGSAIYFTALSMNGMSGIPYPPRIHSDFEIFMHIFPPLRILEIIAGLALGLFIHRHYWELKLVIKRLGGPSVVQIFLLFLIAFSLIISCQNSHFTAFFSTHGMLTIPLCLFIAACSMITGPWHWLGTTPPAKHIPLLAISIYLMHIPLFAWHEELCKRYFDIEANKSLIAFIVYFAALLFFSFHLDKTLQRLVANFAEKYMKIDMEKN